MPQSDRTLVRRNMNNGAADVATPAQDEQPHPARGALVSRLVKISFGIAVVVFGAIFVASRRHELAHALSSAQPAWICVSAVFAIAGQWAAALSFRAVLASVARWLPVLDVARVYFVSQLGKYIPGSVWPIVVLAQMCRRYDIPRRAAATGGIVALLISLAMAGIVGSALTVVGDADKSPELWWLLLLIVPCVAVIHPRVLVPSANAAMRVLRRPPISFRASFRTFGLSLVWSAVSWILLGLHCWALVVGLGGSGLRTLPAAIGGFALAYAAGTLFIPAPAGAGVREAVLAIALGGIVESHGSFTSNSVIVLVLISRVMLAILDFAQAGAVLVVGRGKYLSQDRSD